MPIRIVKLTGRAKKDLLKVPAYVVRKLAFWVLHVEKNGIENVRRVPGFHDEPLTGNRFGQRSIRLNIAYRAIYEIDSEKNIKFVSIKEVNKHEY